MRTLLNDRYFTYTGKPLSVIKTYHYKMLCPFRHKKTPDEYSCSTSRTFYIHQALVAIAFAMPRFAQYELSYHVQLS